MTPWSPTYPYPDITPPIFIFAFVSARIIISLGIIKQEYTLKLLGAVLLISFKSLVVSSYGICRVIPLFNTKLLNPFSSVKLVYGFPSLFVRLVKDVIT